MEQQLVEALTNSTPEKAFMAGTIFSGFLAFFAIIWVITIIGNWKLFEKAGEKGWKSLIPIYSTYIKFRMLHITNWFWYVIIATVLASVLMSLEGFKPYEMTDEQLLHYDYLAHPTVIVAYVFSGVTEFIAAILMARNGGKAFKKSLPFTLGLFFFPAIFWLVLGFNSDKYSEKRIDA